MDHSSSFATVDRSLTCMMKLLLLCALLAIAEARVIDPCINATTIHDVVQEKRILKTGVDSPYQFAIDHVTNTLFFSYSNNKEEKFQSVYVNLNDNSSSIIVGIEGGFANAVDSKNKVVYLGGADGIYKFNYDTKKAIKADITNENIWQLFFKDGLYFTTYADEIAYVYKDGKVKPMPELVGTRTSLVAVDNNDNILHYHEGDLDMIKNDGVKITLGEYNLNAFNTDVDGNVYFSTTDSIYSIKEDGEIVKLTSLPLIYGFAIRSDNTLIYGDEERIIELVPTDEKCYKINS